MLTVKWLEPDGGQRLYQCTGNFSYTPGNMRTDFAPGAGTARPLVKFEENGITCGIDSGVVYVMNETGATISKYILYSEEYPHGVMPE